MKKVLNRFWMRNFCYTQQYQNPELHRKCPTQYVHILVASSSVFIIRILCIHVVFRWIVGIYYGFLLNILKTVLWRDYTIYKCMFSRLFNPSHLYIRNTSIDCDSCSGLYFWELRAGLIGFRWVQDLLALCCDIGLLFICDGWRILHGRRR